VNNYFIFRQQDATRNSVQMLARTHFSNTQCHKKNNSQLQEMLHSEKNINWNDLPTSQKRGRCVKKVNGVWIIDNEIPIFSQDRGYIQNLLATEDD
jgi:tRNA(His) guanylyltransferase